MVAVAVSPGTAGANGRVPDTLRFPYSPGMVYRLKLIPGSPFVVELPEGEHASNVWRDVRYWMAETTEGSSRVLVSPIATSDIVGKKGFIHIETAPSNLRITLKVEAVGEATEVPGALQLYVEGASAENTLRSQVKKAVDSELVWARKAAEEKARAEFEAWKRSTLATFHDDYEWGGDFRIARVVDNRIQTYITVPDGSDKAVLYYVDKTGKKEIINYEYQNGTYLVQNKVLRPGEKFRLVLGKEQAWIGLK
jgi:type IV secretory pathway VirB9-like protein